MKKNNVSITETNIESLSFDDKNFNKGTEFGSSLMDNSIRKFGLGRSILLDKNNRIIAGNKTTEKAGELGFEKVVIVETDGKTLVAVKRNDIDLDSKKGRELALADNATNKANLSWDNEMIMQSVEEFGFEPEDWGVNLSLSEEDLDMPDSLDKEDENKPFVIKITFKDEHSLNNFRFIYENKITDEYNATISVSGGKL